MVAKTKRGSRVLGAEDEEVNRDRETNYNQQRISWSKGQYQREGIKGENLDNSQAHEGEKDELRLRNVLLAKKVAADKVRKHGTGKIPNTESRENFYVGSETEEPIRSLLLSSRDLIEPGVLKDALEGNDKAISLALGQIHHKSLERSSCLEVVQEKVESKSFKEVLLNDTKANLSRMKFSNPSVNHLPKENKIVFFTGFADNTQTKDLWILFKEFSCISDIILPRKRDKFNKRYGFAIAANAAEALKLVVSLNGFKLGNNTLVMEFAKSRKVEINISDLSNSKAERPPSCYKHENQHELSPKK